MGDDKDNEDFVEEIDVEETDEPTEYEESTWGKNVDGQYIIDCCHTRLHLGFSAKLRIWQGPARKMEP